MNLSFHLFKFQRGPASWMWCQGLISLEPFVHGFGPLPELWSFVDQFFLVTPSAHKLMLRFALLGMELREDASSYFSSTELKVTFSWGITYMCTKLKVTFISDLGYFGGGPPTKEVDHKCLQHLIDI